MCLGRGGVESEGLRETRQAVLKRWPQPYESVPALQAQVVGVETLGGSLDNGSLLFSTLRDPESVDYRSHNGILHREHIVAVAVVPLGLEAGAVADIDQPCRHAQLMARRPDAAFQDGLTFETCANLGRCRSPWPWRGRRRCVTPRVTPPAWFTHG